VLKSALIPGSGLEVRKRLNAINQGTVPIPSTQQATNDLMGNASKSSTGDQIFLNAFSPAICPGASMNSPLFAHGTAFLGIQSTNDGYSACLEKRLI